MTSLVSGAMKEGEVQELSFVHANGGPLIIVPRDQLPHWHGNQPVEQPTASSSGPDGDVSLAQTDYEGTCNAPACS